jgi:hypothetical protein
MGGLQGEQGSLGKLSILSQHSLRPQVSEFSRTLGFCRTFIWEYTPKTNRTFEKEAVLELTLFERSKQKDLYVIQTLRQDCKPTQTRFKTGPYIISSGLPKLARVVQAESLGCVRHVWF